MFCTKCGKQLPESAVFCTSCGAKIKQNDKATNENKIAGISKLIGKNKPIIFACAAICFVVLGVIIFVLFQPKSVKDASTEGLPSAASVSAPSGNPIPSQTSQGGSSEQIKEKRYSDAQVGSIIKFGKYEQDNNSSNGKEDIEWQVIDKADDRILVICKYALDAKPYNDSQKNVTWENCSLRKWLNSEFFNTAFDAEDQSIIVNTRVTADINPDYKDIPAGNDTDDRVFLLSVVEARRYYTSNAEGMCIPTEYALSAGAWTTRRINADKKHNLNGKATGWWWLRSPGLSRDEATGVGYEGYVGTSGSVSRSDGMVRPVLWLSI